jgi:hypothetical protein
MDRVRTRQSARLAELSNKESAQEQPHLPTEIWSRIANSLSIRDAARACGTCKAFYAIQPPAMFHKRQGWGPEKLSELIWGLRHGKETEILWLDFWWYVTEQVCSTPVWPPLRFPAPASYFSHLWQNLMGT